MSGIHQFVPMLHRRDAVGSHALGLRDLLRCRGISSEIYVEIEDPETATETRPAATFAAHAERGDVLVYQFATASDLAAWLVRRHEPLVVEYHNLTPPEHFVPWDTGLVRHQLRAREELGSLAERSALGIAMSDVSRRDLAAAGFEATEVVPPIARVITDAKASAALPARSPRRAGARWLSVGRLAPNKAVEDAVAALLTYRMLYDREASLLVVGRPSLPSYAEALRCFVAELGLADAVRFAGNLDDEHLDAAYAEADVLVVASEHEGYCLPIVEAMGRGLPVVAYREGAVPEVLGDAGILLDTKEPLALAEAVWGLQTDGQRRDRLVAAGRARLPELGLAEAGARRLELLADVRARPRAGIRAHRG